ncbi:MAG: hypothetical protein VX257_12220 [Planctomycetota bacterium]|nr:hypothetical protein [Planctomycetota bacterium]
MKSRYALTAVLFGTLLASASTAAELTSGLEVDGRVTTYKATKCGGAVDGIAVGQSLCYT